MIKYNDLQEQERTEKFDEKKAEKSDERYASCFCSSEVCWY